MNPSTDRLSEVTTPDGRTITVLQPGALVKEESRHWRLRREAFERFRQHIEIALANWPAETKFGVPSGVSPNTFEHRMRDAIQALIAFQYDPALYAKLVAIRTELTVSMDPDGKHVWIRAKSKQGRKVALHATKSTHIMPLAPQPLALTSVPDRETLTALMTLAAKGVRKEPITFPGILDASTISWLESSYDTAVVHDEASNQTTIL